MNNGRDCPHGRQVGKCDTCDLIKAELELEKVKADRDALSAHIEALRRELQACQNVLHMLAHDGQVTPAYAYDAKKVLAETPQHHMAAHDAEVAKAAFISGATNAAAFISLKIQQGESDIDLDAGKAADKYVLSLSAKAGA